MSLFITQLIINILMGLILVVAIINWSKGETILGFFFLGIFLIGANHLYF